MAEPKPVDPTAHASEAAPKLQAVSETSDARKPAPAAAAPTRRGVSRGLFAVVAVLLVLALAGLWAQSQRASAQADQILGLQSQVEGLEAQLSAANTKLASYDMQMTLIQDGVNAVFDEMAELFELVNMTPHEAARSQAGSPEETAPTPEEAPPAP